MADTPNKKGVFTPSLPRDHLEVTYELNIQGTVLHGTWLVFTARTTKKVTAALNAMLKRCLITMGIEDEPVVTIIEFKRKESNAKIKDA